MNSPLLQVLFWLSATVISYTYVLYPLCVAILAYARPEKIVSKPFRGSVSIIIAAHNESASIARRIVELLTLLEHTGCTGELILVSDGSSDDTVDQVNAIADRRVRILALPHNVGKASALSQGCALATGDVMIFADARQRWDPQAVTQLLGWFGDPRIGAVSGELILEDAVGVVSGVGLYWRYEKWLRHNEGRIHSVVGVSGSICAVRRSLFTPIPTGTLLDDVYWPMQVVLQGWRVVHDPLAIAYDQLPATAAREFRRKVRTLCGNFQLFALLPQAFSARQNPIWLQFWSHKILRLVVPWALLLLLGCSLFLSGSFYRLALYSQLVTYGLGIAGLVGGPRNSRLTAAAGSFLVLNAAAWLAFWVWLTGRAANTWVKTACEQHAENRDSN